MNTFLEQGDALVQRVLELQDTQAAGLEATPLESQYRAAFESQVEAKHDQVERIEERIEHLIELQGSTLQQLLASKPGMLVLPATRDRWQQQLSQRQDAIKQLERRLERVREISEGMGVHAPRIEELAARKLRFLQPELTRDWNALQEERRKTQALDRNRGHEAANSHKQGQRPGRGLSLELSATL